MDWGQTGGKVGAKWGHFYMIELNLSHIHLFSLDRGCWLIPLGAGQTLPENAAKSGSAAAPPVPGAGRKVAGLRASVVDWPWAECQWNQR